MAKKVKLFLVLNKLGRKDIRIIALTDKRKEARATFSHVEAGDVFSVYTLKKVMSAKIVKGKLKVKTIGKK
jgi:hypothetical protein